MLIDGPCSYAGSEEIYEYYKSFAAKYNLYDRIKLQHKVKSAVWSAGKNEWDIEVEDLQSGHVFQTTADVLVNASGALRYVLVQLL
jgi:cation diffusion facilitator CzcD-associated flavoprotein CzcO